MKITHFTAKDVNGYLNFDIQLNNNLNFIIGSNGSGKTTAIKLILGLMSPSLINLTQISYEFAQIVCDLDGKVIKIKAERVEHDKIKLSIENSTEKVIYSSIKIPPAIENDYTKFEYRHYVTRFTRYETVFNELDAVKKIRELVTPTFLGLDRRIHDGKEIDFLSIDSFLKEIDYTSGIKGNLYESLMDVNNLIKESFLKYNQDHTSISAELKNEIIYSSFDVIKENENNQGISIKTDINIEETKSKIIEASKNIEIPNLHQKIVNYFKELERIQKSLQKEQEKKGENFIKFLGQWFINSPQLERIQTIIKLYENAQNKIKEKYEHFNRFEKLINTFFAENNKKVVFKKNGEIEILLPNEKPTSIFKLSSGEKQIIIMIAQLIFGKFRQVFIIDEPELSLHLGWQEIFVKSIIEASPDTQFILATHSPSIIGSIENERYCIDITNDAAYGIEI